MRVLASTEMSSLPSPSQGGGGLFYREFPPEILRRLEHLAFVKDPDDLGAKYAQAIAWFRGAIEAIDERQVRRLIHGTTTPPGGDSRITRGAARTPGSTPSRGSIG